MRITPDPEKWVVYESLDPKTLGVKFVCSTSQWQAAQAKDPGLQKLIQDDITDENVAEKLARGTAGDLKPRKTTPRPKFKPLS